VGVHRRARRRRTRAVAKPFRVPLECSECRYRHELAATGRLAAFSLVCGCGNVISGLDTRDVAPEDRAALTAEGWKMPS
jgi:hypothetical protein